MKFVLFLLGPLAPGAVNSHSYSRLNPVYGQGGTKACMDVVRAEQLMPLTLLGGKLMGVFLYFSAPWTVSFVVLVEATNHLNLSPRI